ncbi:MAG: 2-oxo acid dehydrogenase subunit E2 [Granulosicoccus sp.]
MSEANVGQTVDIIVPDIGDAEDVEVIEILVSAGDQVAVDDSLITLESDKASMEVPAASAGVIESINVSVGDQVRSGAVIGKMSVLNTAADEPASNTTTDNSTSTGSDDVTAAERAAGEADSSAAAPSADTATSSVESPATTTVASSTSTTDQSAGQSATPVSTQHAASPTAHISDEKMRKAHASPGVRRYARELGADLSLVSGKGPKGRILKTDIKAYIKKAMEGMSSPYGISGGGASSGTGIPPIPEIDFSKFGDIERVELSRINKLTATNLHRAWLNVPMVTHHDAADITEMEAFRQQLKQEQREADPKVTGLAFHMKTLVATLKAFPRVNSSMSGDGQSLIQKNYYHIGIAVDTPAGLVVPVFRDVDRKSIFELATEMADVSTRARKKRLKPDEMQGASMTISSLGGIGGTAFTPIVNPPEVAILGITRASQQPVWNGDSFEPRLMCPLDLSYDHRVVDGAEAARFMAYYIKTISDIKRLLL